MTAMINHPRYRVFVGDDINERLAIAVAESSLQRHAGGTLDLHRLSRHTLGESYTRPTVRDEAGGLWDVISDAPMSTDHAIARFFIPWLCDFQGWALFVDGDILCRRDVRALFDLAHRDYAVMCVQHAIPVNQQSEIKKDGALQTFYARKNWSSVMLINCGHPAIRQWTLHICNHKPGRDLHRFYYLLDHEIGALDAGWNYLVNVNPPLADPAIVHYTLGLPSINAHANDPFADEWFDEVQATGFDQGPTKPRVAISGSVMKF